MPRRRVMRKDGNHDDIVSAFEDVGATVLDLSGVGGGAPDIAVGFRKQNYLVEIKDENAPKADQQLRDNQKQWHQLWQGQVAVVRNTTQALNLIGLAPLIGTIE